MLLLSLLSNPLLAVFYITILILTVSIHEYAHARVADELGDPTAQLAGRLTLNPLAHLDPIGSIAFLMFGFGWGKPVPFDPYNLKNPRRDSAYISLAGPLSNFLMAILLSILIYFFKTTSANSLYPLISPILAFAIQINLILGLFNLIPIGPLDGFKIVGGFLPESQAHEWYSLERYGLLFMIFMFIPFLGNRSMLDIVLSPTIKFFYKLLVP
ncbi:hypothetical protein A3C23_04865 [Candidatus Roizmanbacteria bacterium RIFCSPHIGHO2_02_FULL_37_13b]|uniref:Peptidase M50 domain-containing protein n=1 Tax=Candidatus Roizmanbacteria bacterium RIFCSPLOWO2_02_FULL_36_11 TaxID=1802071 RepID=A0A1F7JIE1_9BACT|nr:MAG: hypothetical protein A3C23_04865 [Candidatus Roizmanbacteria bacterium RIFCSPHIGHO2_02_FULL_37_13b]OGK55361.1 MAG: hypothetical protein A3H78_03600 [Candidatus Roizmanbacteria bacterium RIFCSPLOWO2_02_FULL_36_11]